MHIPNLNAFRYFDVAAQTCSFVQAAQILHVTHGAVSRQIRALEQSLGVTLFERRNRAVFLTTAGKQLKHVTTPMFEQLEELVLQFSRTPVAQTLVVSCEPTIAMKWLIPRLGLFQANYPEIDIHLLTGGGPIDFLSKGVDLAIRRDDFHWADSVSGLKLCEERIGPVCQTAYASHYDTSSAVLIHTHSRPQAWNTWQRISQTHPLAGQSTWLEHFYLCIQAALSGQGIAITSWLMVQDELKSGQLIAPQGFLPDGSHYYLLSPQALEENEAAYQFAHWLKQQLTPEIS